MRIQSLSWEDPLEEGMATHSSIPAWRIPMDWGAWLATVHRVTKSWTRLKWLNTYAHVLCCSVIKLCPTLFDPVDCSPPGFPILWYLPEFAQTQVHWVSDAIQLSHPLSSPSPPAFNLSQHQGLFQWVNSLHQVAKVLELQLQYQSFQWIFRVDFL